ncbi:MAG: hypothetical protein J7641_19450 [Cyanobacteria bacterium SID2]|nr:hypothetical protein [Cyanobacteria bacterium SID2]
MPVRRQHVTGANEETSPGIAARFDIEFDRAVFHQLLEKSSAKQRFDRQSSGAS